MVGYTDTVRLIAAWCEAKQAFRHFRADSITAADFLDDRHGLSPSDLRKRWERSLKAERAAASP